MAKPKPQPVASGWDVPALELPAPKPEELSPEEQARWRAIGDRYIAEGKEMAAAGERSGELLEKFFLAGLCLTLAGDDRMVKAEGYDRVTNALHDLDACGFRIQLADDGKSVVEHDEHELQLLHQAADANRRILGYPPHVTFAKLCQSAANGNMRAFRCYEDGSVILNPEAIVDRIRKALKI